MRFLQAQTYITNLSNNVNLYNFVDEEKLTIFAEADKIFAQADNNANLYNFANIR